MICHKERIVRSVWEVLTGLLCLSALAATAHGNMTLTIPKAQQPPKLDGVLSGGEWDDAAAVSGVINQFDGLAHPRQAVFWLKYDDENFYVAHRSTVLPQERETRAPQLWLDHDSSIVVCLAPGRIGRGDEPSHFLLRCNIDKRLWTREITWKLKGVKVTFPHPSWPVEAKVEQVIKEGVWTAEIAIPLTSLKAADLKDGEEWGLLLARDYSGADQNAIVQSSDWRFGSGRRHYGLAFYNNYRLEKEYARAVLRAGAPAVQLLDLGRIVSGKLSPQMAVKNTGTGMQRVTLRFEIRDADEAGGRIKPQEVVLVVKEGERKESRFKSVSLPAGKESICIFSAVSADGTTLYRQEIPVKPGFYEDRVRPVPDVYFVGYHFGGRQADRVLLSTCYDPITNEVYGRVRVGGLPEGREAARGELTVRRQGEEAPLAVIPFRKGWPPEVAERPNDTDWTATAKLPALAPGLYEATACIYAADNRLIGRSRQNFIRYDHAKDMPWIGNKLGVTNKVLPPWTAIESDWSSVNSNQKGTPITDDRSLVTSFSCWGRRYRVDGSGLFSSISAASESGLERGPREVLAAPVRIEIRQEGKLLKLKPGRKLSRVSLAPNEAGWQGVLSGGGWKITTTAHMEYDGYVEHKIRIEAPKDGPGKADSIRLVIPLRPEEATHLHAAAGEWFRSSVSSIALDEKEGQLWHSGQNHGGGITPHGKGYGSKMTVGNFKPYVWVGGANRGLAFMADNDQGWVPDDTKKVPAIEVVRKGGHVNLVLNLVARAFTFDKAREITFSLQATPIKPMPDDYRFRRRKLTMMSAFPGQLPGDAWNWSWTGTRYQIQDGKGGRKWLFGLPGSCPYPPNWDQAIRYQTWSNEGRFHGKNWTNTPYQSQQNVHSFPEVDDPRMPPGKQAGNVYGYIFPHMSSGHLEHGNGSMAQVDIDYRLYNYNAWIKHAGITGMYFDQTEPVLSANPKAGFGYVLDLPDRPKLHGKVQPGYGLTRVREFYKRLRTLFVEHGQEYPSIWIHSTDADMVSVFAFCDFFLEGENNPRISSEHPYVSEKIPAQRMQAMHNGAGKWGIAMTQLEMYGDVYPHTHPLHNAAFRNMHGWLMLHDCEGSHHGEPWHGIDLKRQAEFLPYWDPTVSALLSTGQDQVFASAWRQNNKLIVVVFNNTAEDKPAVTLEAVPERLGIKAEAGKAFAVVDLEADKPIESVVTKDNTVSVMLPVKARDYRMIRFEQK